MESAVAFQHWLGGTSSGGWNLGGTSTAVEPSTPNSSSSAYHLLRGSLTVKLQINDCTSQRFLDGLIQPGPQYKAIKVTYHKSATRYLPGVTAQRSVSPASLLGSRRERALHLAAPAFTQRSAQTPSHAHTPQLSRPAASGSDPTAPARRGAHNPRVGSCFCHFQVGFAWIIYLSCTRKETTIGCWWEALLCQKPSPSAAASRTPHPPACQRPPGVASRPGSLFPGIPDGVFRFASPTWECERAAVPGSAPNLLRADGIPSAAGRTAPSADNPVRPQPRARGGAARWSCSDCIVWNRQQTWLCVVPLFIGFIGLGLSLMLLKWIVVGSVKEYVPTDLVDSKGMGQDPFFLSKPSSFPKAMETTTTTTSTTSPATPFAGGAASSRTPNRISTRLTTITRAPTRFPGHRVPIRASPRSTTARNTAAPPTVLPTTAPFFSSSTPGSRPPVPGTPSTQAMPSWPTAAYATSSYLHDSTPSWTLSPFQDAASSSSSSSSSSTTTTTTTTPQTSTSPKFRVERILSAESELTKGNYEESPAELPFLWEEEFFQLCQAFALFISQRTYVSGIVLKNREHRKIILQMAERLLEEDGQNS
ncbi:PREDICTED: uncharacterized protein LOC104984464 [Bison bison bison]|uniref:Uncharacterized protein LOC104984464 n=1 Tax=Bison bison bison TaxID=43346 RepID=A0A6P3H028_BISBB|nr:PREDICTED: uncharacterized protein LOC104984464 [Bison bison bison]